MDPLLTSIFIYIVLVICIYSFKPKFCFIKNKMKSFGLGKNKTPFTFLMVSVVLGIFSLIIGIIYKDFMVPISEDIIDVASQIIQ